MTGLIACDWGTTKLRAWRLDGEGEVVARREFPLGVSRLPPGQAGAVFETEVRPSLAGEGLPAILCGMIGSNLGWTAAGYVDCPADPMTLACGLVLPAPGVAIVPGLQCPGLSGPDVMRGEETQVLGWLAADPARRRGWRGLCLPGTHAKWVAVADGVIARFVTAMTGELYDLLMTHSVLRAPAATEDMSAFSLGVAVAGDGSALASRLFSARGRFLEGELPEGSVASYLSGLLIGAEIGALWPRMRVEGDDSVEVIGDPALTRLYAHALELRKIKARTTDGDSAALEGLKAIWRQAA